VRLPPEGSVEQMLTNGEIDAVLHPDLIRPLVEKDPRVARLFPDHRREEVAFFRKTGIFPIMHVLGIKREIAEEHPWVAINVFRAFNEAKSLAMKRAWRIRGSCHSRSIAKRGRSRKNSWVRIPGNTV